MKEQKEKIKTDKAELNENELEKVDGGMKADSSVGACLCAYISGS